jgi:hypothetical protein
MDSPEVFKCIFLCIREDIIELVLNHIFRKTENNKEPFEEWQ